MNPLIALLRRLLRALETAPQPAAPALPAVPQRELERELADEEDRIGRFRATASGLLTTFGAIAVVVFTSVSLKAMPNLGDPSTGLATWVAAVAVVLGLGALVWMAVAVANVQITPEVNLRLMARDTTPGRWFNDPSLYNYDHQTLQEVLNAHQHAVTNNNVSLADRLEDYLARVRHSARRRRVFGAYDAAIETLQTGGLVFIVGAAAYLAALAYKVPADPTPFIAPARAFWHPTGGSNLTAEQKTESRKEVEALLGPGCGLDRLEVILLGSDAERKAFDAIVSQGGCRPAKVRIEVGKNGQVEPHGLVMK